MTTTQFQLVCLSFPTQADADAALVGYTGTVVRVDISRMTGANLGTPDDPVPEVVLVAGLHLNVIGGALVEAMLPYVVTPETPSAEILQ